MKSSSGSTADGHLRSRQADPGEHGGEFPFEVRQGRRTRGLRLASRERGRLGPTTLHDLASRTFARPNIDPYGVLAAARSDGRGDFPDHPRLVRPDEAIARRLAIADRPVQGLDHLGGQLRGLGQIPAARSRPTRRGEPSDGLVGKCRAVEKKGR